MILKPDTSRHVNLGNIDPSKIRAYGVGSPVVMQTIVRQSMYSDPHRACVVEYYCNAMDAQRERKLAEPDFDDSILPTIKLRDGKSLSIEDRGRGISKHRMENNFASYFSSTKSDTNDQIGGYGLGCKTAFADPNRDSFTVETVYLGDDGIKYFYLTYHYIRSDGLTAYAEIQHDPVDISEETGTKIVLPIDESELDLYVAVLKRLFFYWDIKPQISGFRDFVWHHYAPFIKNDKWHFNPSKKALDIVIEGIPYEVDRQHLPQELKTLQAGVALFFKTGEIAVTSTRESIDYRGDSVLKVEAVLTEAVAEIKEALRTRLDEVPLVQIPTLLKTLNIHIDRYDSIRDGTACLKGRLLRVFKSGETIRFKRSSYVSVSETSAILFRKSVPMRLNDGQLGRTRTFFDQNPHIEELFIVGSWFYEDREAAIQDKLNDSILRRLDVMVPENHLLEHYEIHPAFRRPTAIKKKRHKFFYILSGGRWLVCEKDREIPHFAFFTVCENEQAPGSYQLPALLDEVRKQIAGKPIFLVKKKHASSIPGNWISLKSIALKKEQKHAIHWKSNFPTFVFHPNRFTLLRYLAFNDDDILETRMLKRKARRKASPVLSSLLSLMDHTDRKVTTSSPDLPDHPIYEVNVGLNERKLKIEVAVNILTSYPGIHNLLRRVLSVAKKDLQTQKLTLEKSRLTGHQNRVKFLKSLP